MTLWEVCKRDRAGEDEFCAKAVVGCYCHLRGVFGLDEVHVVDVVDSKKRSHFTGKKSFDVSA